MRPGSDAVRALVVDQRRRRTNGAASVSSPDLPGRVTPHGLLDFVLLKEALVSSFRVVDPRGVSRRKGRRKAGSGGVAGLSAFLVSQQRFEHHVEERFSVEAVL